MPRTGYTSEELLELILELTEETIREAGFKNLKLNQLGNRLGVSHAALYKHVSSKEALLDLVSERWLLKIDENLRSISMESLPAYDLLMKWFITYHKLKLEKVRKDPEIYKTFNMSVEKKKDFVQTHLEELKNQLTDIVKRGKEEKMFKRFSTKETVMLLMEGTTSFHHPFLVAESKDEDRIKELKDLLETMVQGFNSRKEKL